MTYTPTLPHWYDRTLRRTDTASDNVTVFAKLLESLQRAGLDPSPFPECEQVNEIAATAKATAEAFRSARDVSATVSDLAAQVVAGKLDPAKAMVKAATLETLSAGNGTANDLDRITQAHYTAEARRLMRQPGDRWVTDMFRPKVDALASQLPSLVASLPARIVTNLDNEAENNRRIREAWGRITDRGPGRGGIRGRGPRCVQPAIAGWSGSVSRSWSRWAIEVSER